MRSSKRPKYKENPSMGKKPSIVEDVDALEGKNFKWKVTSKWIDYDEDEWGWGNVPMKRFFNKCLSRLQHYEGQTWAKIKEERNCHPVALRDIVPRAQKRITTNHDDMSDLYQVKADGKCRLFGYKDRQIFYLIWHDKDHTVYPSGE